MVAVIAEWYLFSNLLLRRYNLRQERDFYPGLGDGQNKFSLTGTIASGVKLNLEQHASVPEIEERGLHTMGLNIVNVAQKLEINYSKGSLSISASTDVFPSATLSLNGTSIMQYNQPSFMKTHSLPIKGYSGAIDPMSHAAPQPIYDYSYKPANWYKRL